MRLGSTTINKAYLGATEISKIMLGSVEVFGGAGPGPTVSEVVDGGITFEFASAVTVGQYISGDYWALNATVDAVLPVSAQVDGTYDNAEAYTDRWVHGLMVNPGRDGGTGANPATTPQGWDSLPKAPAISQATEFAYDHTKNLDPAATTLNITGPASLVKSLSILVAPKANSREKLDETALLTIVDSAPASNAFRRWAGNVNKAPIFFASDIDWTVLPSLTQPVGSTLPDPDALIAKLGPLQTYMNQQLFARGVAPLENQSGYGADIANDINQAIFYTMTAGVSEANRNRVAYRIIQAGLDIYDAIEYGRRWSSVTFSFGGGHQWLKTAMVYAARLLHNAANTAEVTKLVNWCNGTTNPIFADDIIIFPITRNRIESVPFETITTRLWPTGFPDWSENTIDYLAKPSSGDKVGLNFDLAYRATNANPFMQSALIFRLLGAVSVVNNPQFFDYIDRWFNAYDDRSRPSSGFGGWYLYAYPKAMVDDYYTTNWGAASGSLASVRLESRGLYAWIETAENLDISFQPLAAEVVVEVDNVPQTLTSASTTAGGTASSGSTNTSQPVITVASATGIKIGQRIECGSLPLCFVVAISGTTIGISERVPTTFSGQAIEFHNVFVFGRSLVAVLPTPLVDATPVVEIGYTAPGSGWVRNLRGTQLSNVTLAATTNRTGVLPAGPSTIETPYSGAVLADRQYSGTIALQAAAVRRFRMSMRFVLNEAPLQNDTWVSSNTGGTANFRLYAATTSALRISFGGRQFRTSNSALNTLPLDQVITLHLLIDGTAMTNETANRGTLVWDGGSIALNTSASTGLIDGTYTTAIETVFQQGVYINARGTGVDAPEGGVQELTIGWGDDAYTLPANFSGSEFAWDAAWGANGQNVWGQNQLYYAGTVAEWNGGMPNRGSYGSLSLNPLRFLDVEEGILLTDYTAYPFP